MGEMLTVDAASDALAGLGFERIQNIPGSTYRDNSTVIVIPTLGSINYKVVQTWQGLIAPMNQKRAVLFCTGDEVGHAYNRMIEMILADPNLSKWQYVMTLEDDNLQPPDAHIRLLETVEWGHFDGVSGIYFTKGDVGMPMAYGNPEQYKATGVLEFEPRDVRAGLSGGNIMEVNGIAMGCALWKLDLFRELSKPWFVTIADMIPDRGAVGFTQDLSFCKRAKEAGKRFAVDFRVKVGHLDVQSGIVY